MFQLIFIILFISVLALIAFCIFTVVGIGFLSFLGFEYDSVKSVLFFFLVYFCVNTPVDFVCTFFLDIAKYVSRLPHPLYKLLESLLDISITFITINVIDYFMSSICIPYTTGILFSILSYMLSQCSDFLRKERNKI
ncbi:YrvL family regulatory protein [Romboutsia weinsteinii]|uniref:YrvL family regulatory protein n=1 Tax=Romboutsia weinsteinii TaxID=2020949 RepID=UPI001FB178AE